jgi:hypothetical protein
LRSELRNDAVGAETYFLKAYNTSAEIMALTPGQNSFGWPGLGNPSTPTGSNGPLNGRTVKQHLQSLNIKIAATTTAITPITAIPATLINNTYWTAAM